MPERMFPGLTRQEQSELDKIDPIMVRKTINTFERRDSKKRLLTGLISFDEVTNGLPIGLTVIYGEPGAGKSNLCKAIALSTNSATEGKVIYVTAEDTVDSPEGVMSADFARIRKKPRDTLYMILTAIQLYKPKLVLLDSATSLFGAGNPVVPEADVRTAVEILDRAVSGIVSVVLTDEVRYGGDSPAGGFMVIHKGIMTIHLKKEQVNHFNSEVFRMPEYSWVYLFNVDKDRDGQAVQSVVHTIKYEDGQPVIQPILMAWLSGKGKRDG